VFGVRVNAVSPWFTETPLTAPLLGQPDRLHRVVERTPMKRVAQADEMAAAIAFLAMNKASYITGQNLIVDGGLTANAL
jgi:tropinone reductase I